MSKSPQGLGAKAHTRAETRHPSLNRVSAGRQGGTARGSGDNTRYVWVASERLAARPKSSSRPPTTRACWFRRGGVIPLRFVLGKPNRGRLLPEPRRKPWRVPGDAGRRAVRGGLRRTRVRSSPELVASPSRGRCGRVDRRMPVCYLEPPIRKRVFIVRSVRAFVG